jgi:hypothetical protein
MNDGFLLPVAVPTEDVTRVEVRCFHRKAGPNYFTDGTVEPGFYLSVDKVAIQDEMERRVLGTGRAKLLELGNRTSKKKVQVRRQPCSPWRSCAVRPGGA